MWYIFPDNDTYDIMHPMYRVWIIVSSMTSCVLALPDATICIPGNPLQHRAVATSCNWVVQECTLSYLNAANKPKTRVVVCPALVLPGNSVPGWTISRDPGKPGKYKFVAVYINNWQQTPTFLTFCIQTQWEREKYCKTSTRAVLQYSIIEQ